MNDVFEKKVKNLGFVPFNFSKLDDICNMIRDHEDIQKIITENKFDDLAVSWEGMFLHQVYHLLKEVDWSKYDERMNSILYSALESQTMQLEWIMFSLFYGQYDLVLRELRNIVESAFLFYRFDFLPANRKLSGEDKIKQIESVPERETYGKMVFQLSGYNNWQDIYENVYKELCYYTHTKISKDRTREAYPEYNQMLSPVFYDQDIFKCLYYFQKVILIEVDMMKTQLKDVYDVDAGHNLDGIFDKIVIPEP